MIRGSAASAAIGTPEVQPAPAIGSPDVHPDMSREATPVSVINLATVVLKHRWLIAAFVVLMAFPAGLLSLTSTRTYSATTTFISSGSRQSSPAAGLAAQFGFVTPGETGHSPEFYADLLTSREILRPAAENRYEIATPEGTRQGALSELYGFGANPSPRDRERTLARLRNQVGATSSPRTAVITLTVTTEYPDLSAQIATSMLDRLTAFNLERRRQKAAADREFTESQLQESLGELRAAENRLQNFLTVNREYRLSPRLVFEHDRLAREVEMRQELYKAVAQAYEQVKSDELRESPMLTVIQPPETPVLPNARGTLRRTASAAVVGLILGMLIAFTREYVRRSRALSPVDSSEFERLKRETLADLRPWRRARRA